jgi:hypothetical protein
MVTDISFEALGEHILDLERVIGLCRECGFLRWTPNVRQPEPRFKV